MARRGEMLALLLLAAACTPPPAPDPWKLWSIDTLAKRGDPAYVPAGATLRLLSSPFAAGTATQLSGRAGLTVFPAFSEGKPAAYLTTEIWQNFDEVWLQPLYIPLKSLTDTNTLKGKPIFGVDATTRFYSPFWQIYWYVPPDGADFKSAKDVIDSGLPLVEGPGKFCAITGDDSLGAVVAQGAAGPVRPLTGEATGVPGNGAAYANGKDVWFIDLGTNRFTWNRQTLIVDETPLFAFAVQDADGSWREADVPRVGGTGPLHAPSCDGHGNCAGLPASGKPQFGALWRVWDVALPATADVYVPPSQPALRAYAQSQGFKAALPSFEDAQFSLRVAINPGTCFANVASCVWLDSQNAIETNLPDWRASQTGTLVSCPLTLFNGKALGP